jgi:hypothetical protein
MSIKFSTLLTYQFAYGLTGIGVNGASALSAAVTGQYLTPTDPIVGSVVMSGYCLFLVTGLLGFHVMYRCLMALSIVGLGYGGVVMHLQQLQSSPELYASTAAGLCGMFVNVVGLILNLTGASGQYRIATNNC